MKEKQPKSTIYGNRIKFILVKKGMSPQELSDLTGILPSHISRIINGQRRCISLPIAMKICIALKSTVEQVFIYEKPFVPQLESENDGN